MHAFNKISVKLTISGRREKQHYSIDDDKCALDLDRGGYGSDFGGKAKNIVMAKLAGRLLL